MGAIAFYGRLGGGKKGEKAFRQYCRVRGIPCLLLRHKGHYPDAKIRLSGKSVYVQVKTGSYNIEQASFGMCSILEWLKKDIIIVWQTNNGWIGNIPSRLALYSAPEEARLKGREYGGSGTPWFSAKRASLRDFEQLQELPEWHNYFLELHNTCSTQ